FAVMLALMAGLGYVAITQLNEVNNISSEIEVTWLPAAITLGNINTETSDLRIATLQHIATLDSAEREKYERDIATILNDLRKNQSDYENIAKLIPAEQKKAYEDFKSLFSEYIIEHEKILNLSRQNKSDEAKALLRGRSQQLFNDYSNKLLEMI